MFSARIQWSLEPNELSRLLAAKHGNQASILDLTESNPTRAGFEYPPGLLAALDHPAALLYEPAAFGLEPAREAAGAFLGVPKDGILLTASTSEAYGYLFKLLCDPGDHVLVPQPSYPLFEFLARLDCVEISTYPLIYDRCWQVDFEALERRITPRTRAVLAVNPNNPTGNYLDPACLERLDTLAAVHDMALIIDEVFSCYPIEERSPAIEPAGAALTFRLNGLSKLAGLPQIKAAWILMDGPPDLLPRARERLELIADTYLSVSTPVMHALPTLLEQSGSVRQQIHSRIRSNWRRLKDICDPLVTEGGWYATLHSPGADEEHLVLDLLHDDNVLIQPGFFFDFPAEGYFIVSLLTPPEQFVEGMRRVVRRIPGVRGASTPFSRDTAAGS